MKREAIKDYFVLNGELISTNDMEIFDKINENSVYEVIRIIDGLPLFLEEHLDRMKKSAEIVDFKIERKENEIKKDINTIIEKNKVKNLNIKLLCSDVEGKGQVFLVYFIESYYPEQKVYEKGIHTILYHFERKNPNAEILNISFKEKVNKKIKNKNAFEAILVNKKGYITEGSRSNIFFVKDKDSKIYTAPDKDILSGITRNHILEICKELNIEVVEENIHVEDLYRVDAAFMTDTSVNVLPITSVDEFSYESVSNPIIRLIGSSYLKKMREYIEEN